MSTNDSPTFSQAAAQQFIHGLPHCAEMKMEILDVGEGSAEMSVPYDPRYIGDPQTGVIHGGVITALLDSCCGAAVLGHPAGRTGTATLDLRIDYMRPAEPEKRIYARAEVYQATRSVAFVRGLAYEETPDNPIASCSCAFTVGTRRPKTKEQG